MPKDDRIYLQHVLETARGTRTKVQGVSRAHYDRDDTLQLALAHLLQTIGEAVRLVSPAGRALAPELPWNAITGMRHRIVHDYLNIDPDIVWNTATLRMDELIAQLEEALKV